MRHKLLSTLLSAFIGASLSAGCHPSSAVPANSGIEFKLTSAADGAPPLRPDGAFRVERLEQQRSVHVPVAPLELGAISQRVELPPGSYAVSYAPVELDSSLRSFRRRDTVKSISHDPFIVVVSKGQFTRVNLRAVDAAGSRPPRAIDTARAP